MSRHKIPYKKKRRQNPEELMQRQQVKFLREIRAYTGQLTFCHVPLELQRDSGIRKIYWHLGCEAGVPDLIIFLSRGRTLFVENKIGTNDLSDKQKEWAEFATNLGHYVYKIKVKEPHEGVLALQEILESHDIYWSRVRLWKHIPTQWADVFKNVTRCFGIKE